MIRLIILRQLGISSLVLCALVLTGSGLRIVSSHQQQSQQPSSAPSPTPPPSAQPASGPVPPVGELPVKRRKVWTNDDVIETRTPADNYQIEKEAKEAAEAAAKLAPKPKATKEAPLQVQLPTSVEETQLLIKNAEQDISDEQASLASLHEELATVPEEQKKAKQKEIDIVTTELDRGRNQLKVLQDHLQALREKSPTENPPAAPPPPSIQ